MGGRGQPSPALCAAVGISAESSFVSVVKYTVAPTSEEGCLGPRFGGVFASKRAFYCTRVSKRGGLVGAL